MFVPVNETKNIMTVKDLPYPDVRNILQEKNADFKQISERSVRSFCSTIDIGKQSNLGKEEFQKIIFLQESKL